jgi:class 3 adenylate cyclase
VLAAEGDLVAAEDRLQTAWRSWHDCELPYEEATTRLALSQVYLEQGKRGLAQLEAKAARNTLSSLGAEGALANIDRLLARLQGDSIDRAITSAWLFSDIVDSTALIQVIGDETWASVLRWHDRALRSLFTDHGGVEIDHTGDGFFVAFDDCASAIACSVAIQETVRRHRTENGYPVQVRIGVHAGEAIDSGESHRGREVHRAARIATAAGAGEILVSVSAAENAPSSASYSEPRDLVAKGFAEPLHVVSVLPVG